ncbi:MAG: GNAT family protein [Rhizobiaceae bacterium]
MRLLNFKSHSPQPAQLVSDRVMVRRPSADDFTAWAGLRAESAEFLRPFEPSWAKNELSRSAFRARLRRHETDIASGRGLPWFLFSREEPAKLLGGLTVSNIRRGIADTGTLGYWMGESYAGKGFMREAVKIICANLFEEHHLHRIEAATVLNNERSQQLLRKCGFSEEGKARAYLKIDGQWRDHILFALLADDIS